MLLRDYLNEFELDWAQAAVRSEQIPVKKLRGKKVLVLGEQSELQRAIVLSFLAWNDSCKAGVCAQQGSCHDGKILMEKPEPDQRSFLPEEADFVIFTGLCSHQAGSSVSEEICYLKEFQKMVKTVVSGGHARLLLLSDGRVYGRLPRDFAASEYEAGQTDCCAPGYEAQYLLQALEAAFVSAAREAKAAFTILRTGYLYGPCLPMMEHPLSELAARTAGSGEIWIELSKDRSSYLSVHDLLLAVQFVLTRCPANKIFNVSGLQSDATEGEIAMLLYQNFPNLCSITMTAGGSRGLGEMQELYAGDMEPSLTEPSGTPAPLQEGAGQEEEKPDVSGGIWLNTQLLCHYGFAPQLSLEDGLIILVKSLLQPGETFLFDHTYLGKLEKVQKILLGYLLEIDRICRKHQIRYFLAGGTLLGAIRHHGFIPWDDDADIMMLREDYDKFLEVAPQELPEHIFLQIPETERGNYNPFTKLRINDTMFATEFTGRFMEMHNGIFFDVLSHDKTGNHRWSQKLHLLSTMLTRTIVYHKWGNTDIQSGGSHPLLCKVVDRLKYLIPMRLALRAQRYVMEFFKNRPSEYLYDGMGRNLKRGAFPACWLDETVYVSFEGYSFPVPREYDKYLTWLYGDYMQMIPVSCRRTSHNIVLMDLGMYSDYRLPRPEAYPAAESREAVPAKAPLSEEADQENASQEIMAQEGIIQEETVQEEPIQEETVQTVQEEPIQGKNVQEETVQEEAKREGEPEEKERPETKEKTAADAAEERKTQDAFSGDSGL